MFWASGIGGWPPISIWILQQCFYGKTILGKLSEDFEILNTFRATCAHLPEISFMDHVELRVLEKEMANLELPTVAQWKTVEKYGKTKYILCGWRLVEDLLKTIED